MRGQCGSATFGGLIGSSTAPNIHFTNNTNNGNASLDVYLTSDGNRDCGGLFGTLDIKQNPNVFSDNVNNGNIDFSFQGRQANVGGVIGRFTPSSSSININRCTNFGLINALVEESMFTKYVSGIVGFSNKNGINMIDCANYGDVIGECSSSSYSYVKSCGLVCAYENNENGATELCTKITVENCINNGICDKITVIKKFINIEN